MGSGELTATMVEVHKRLLSRFAAPPQAFFLDTPAGFQLNAEQIGASAAEYFRKRVGYQLNMASYRACDTISEVDAAAAYRKLRSADYILMGPGSPTYAVNHLQRSSIPEIFIDHVKNDGCLVFASAAALTAGRYTLPVYEIYKVGQPLHWVAGLDILGALGLNMVVIPHWNNAEGGTHDTSRCFMGASRFEKLLLELEEPLPALGLDEHTACVIDFSANTFEVYGIGTVVLQDSQTTQYFSTGKTFSLELLRKDASAAALPADDLPALKEQDRTPHLETSGFWSEVHDVRSDFHQGMKTDALNRATRALLVLDRLLWQAEGNNENPELIAQGRDLFREQLAELGTWRPPTAAMLKTTLEPLIDSLLQSRQALRQGQQYAAADALREALQAAGIAVEDTETGYRWQLVQSEEKR